MHDVKRMLRLQQATKAVSAATDEGFVVRSYGHWTFMDTFEWSSGYGPKFGLYAVNFTSTGRTREARDSVAVYRQIAGAHVDALTSTSRHSQRGVAAKQERTEEEGVRSKHGIGRRIRLHLRMLDNRAVALADGGRNGTVLGTRCPPSAQEKRKRRTGDGASLEPACP